MWPSRGDSPTHEKLSLSARAAHRRSSIPSPRPAPSRRAVPPAPPTPLVPLTAATPPAPPTPPSPPAPRAPPTSPAPPVLRGWAVAPTSSAPPPSAPKQRKGAGVKKEEKLTRRPSKDRRPGWPKRRQQTKHAEGREGSRAKKKVLLMELRHLPQRRHLHSHRGPAAPPPVKSRPQGTTVSSEPTGSDPLPPPHPQPHPPGTTPVQRKPASVEKNPQGSRAARVEGRASATLSERAGRTPKETGGPLAVRKPIVTAKAEEPKNEKEQAEKKAETPRISEPTGRGEGASNLRLTRTQRQVRPVTRFSARFQNKAAPPESRVSAREKAPCVKTKSQVTSNDGGAKEESKSEEPVSTVQNSSSGLKRREEKSPPTMDSKVLRRTARSEHVSFALPHHRVQAAGNAPAPQPKSSRSEHTALQPRTPPCAGSSRLLRQLSAEGITRDIRRRLRMMLAIGASQEDEDDGIASGEDWIVLRDKGDSPSKRAPSSVFLKSQASQTPLQYAFDPGDVWVVSALHRSLSSDAPRSSESRRRRTPLSRSSFYSCTGHERSPSPEGEYLTQRMKRRVAPPLTVTCSERSVQPRCSRDHTPKSSFGRSLSSLPAHLSTTSTASQDLALRCPMLGLTGAAKSGRMRGKSHSPSNMAAQAPAPSARRCESVYVVTTAGSDGAKRGAPTWKSPTGNQDARRGAAGDRSEVRGSVPARHSTEGKRQVSWAGSAAEWAGGSTAGSAVGKRQVSWVESAAESAGGSTTGSTAGSAVGLAVGSARGSTAGSTAGSAAGLTAGSATDSAAGSMAMAPAGVVTGVGERGDVRKPSFLRRLEAQNQRQSQQQHQHQQHQQQQQHPQQQQQQQQVPPQKSRMPQLNVGQAEKKRESTTSGLGLLAAALRNPSSVPGHHPSKASVTTQSAANQKEERGPSASLDQYHDVLTALTEEALAREQPQEPKATHSAQCQSALTRNRGTILLTPQKYKQFMEVMAEGTRSKRPRSVSVSETSSCLVRSSADDAGGWRSVGGRSEMALSKLDVERGKHMVIASTYPAKCISRPSCRAPAQRAQCGQPTQLAQSPTAVVPVHGELVPTSNEVVPHRGLAAIVMGNLSPPLEQDPALQGCTAMKREVRTDLRMLRTDMKDIKAEVRELRVDVNEIKELLSRGQSVSKIEPRRPILTGRRRTKRLSRTGAGAEAGAGAASGTEAGPVPVRHVTLRQKSPAAVTSKRAAPEGGKRSSEDLDADPTVSGTPAAPTDGPAATTSATTATTAPTAASAAAPAAAAAAPAATRGARSRSNGATPGPSRRPPKRGGGMMPQQSHHRSNGRARRRKPNPRKGGKRALKGRSNQVQKDLGKRRAKQARAQKQKRKSFQEDGPRDRQPQGAARKDSDQETPRAQEKRNREQKNRAKKKLRNDATAVGNANGKRAGEKLMKDTSSQQLRATREQAKKRAIEKKSMGSGDQMPRPPTPPGDSGKRELNDEKSAMLPERILNDGVLSEPVEFYVNYPANMPQERSHSQAQHQEQNQVQPQQQNAPQNQAQPQAQPQGQNQAQPQAQRPRAESKITAPPKGEPQRRSLMLINVRDFLESIPKANDKEDPRGPRQDNILELRRRYDEQLRDAERENPRRRKSVKRTVDTDGEDDSLMGMGERMTPTHGKRIATATVTKKSSTHSELGGGRSGPSPEIEGERGMGDASLQAPSPAHVGSCASPCVPDTQPSAETRFW